MALALIGAVSVATPTSAAQLTDGTYKWEYFRNGKSTCVTLTILNRQPKK